MTRSDMSITVAAVAPNLALAGGHTIMDRLALARRVGRASKWFNSACIRSLWYRANSFGARCELREVAPRRLASARRSPT